MISLETLEHMHIEISSRCQASCPMCARNDYGYKVRTDFPITELTLNQWNKIFDSVDLPKINTIVFNGVFGEPTIARDLVEIIDYCFLRWPNINIFVNTNGGARSKEWWHALGVKFKDHKFLVRFGIDGLEDTHELYRINVPYSKVIENAKAFISAGGSAHWKMIPFKHNEHQIEAAKQLSEELGFKFFSLSHQSRDYGYVFTSDTEYYMLEPASQNARKINLHSMTTFKPMQSNYQKQMEKSEDLCKKWVASGKELSCMTLKQKSLFVAANGEVYPCCHIGHYPKQWNKWPTNFDQVIGNDVENNALEVGLEKAISWFYKVEKSWSKDSVNEGVLSTCFTICGNVYWKETT